jgi:hypothetical protein
MRDTFCWRRKIYCEEMANDFKQTLCKVLTNSSHERRDRSHHQPQRSVRQQRELIPPQEMRTDRERSSYSCSALLIHEGAMITAGNNLIESTARALLRERIEATPWFRIKMSKEQRRAAIEREVDAYWHLFIADAAERLLGPAGAGQRSKH